MGWYIEDFLGGGGGVKTKYISSSVLKSSENSDVFIPLNEIYLVFLPKKVIFLFILYFL